MKTESLMPRFEGQLKNYGPYGMSKTPLTRDQREMLEREALDIFTKCSNAGLSLRDILVSILITGMDWGVSASKPQ